MFKEHGTGYLGVDRAVQKTKPLFEVQFNCKVLKLLVLAALNTTVSSVSSGPSAVFVRRFTFKGVSPPCAVPFKLSRIRGLTLVLRQQE